MTLRQSVIWTALPGGITGAPTDRRLRLSVFVSPRLEADQPDAPLSGDFTDWPSNLQPGRVTFSVQVPGAPPVNATVVSQPPDSALWAALFGNATVKAPPSPDDVGGQRVYSSYPVAALHSVIKQGHRQLATDNSALGLTDDHIRRAYPDVVQAAAPTDRRITHTAFTPANLASETDIARLQALHADAASSLLRADRITDQAQRIADSTAVAGRLAEIVSDAPTPVVADTGHPASPFAQVLAFHTGSAQAVPKTEASPPPPRFDFHETMTFLADYPQLMRLFGLVIDLEVPEGALPQSVSGQAQPQRLQVVPEFSQSIAAESHSPFTAYLLEGNRFFEAASATPFAATPGATPAAPAPTENVRGMLNLALDGAFEAIQLDVDGGALKVLGMASALTGQDGAPAADAVGVPALRTSGVTIARSGHAALLMNRMSAAKTANDSLTSGQEVTFFVEDLIRGYRFDVQDVTSGTWHSLHRRVGTYALSQHVGGPLTLNFTDEGTVQPAVTRPPGPDGVTPDPGAPFHIHESLLHWQGWSMAAPRPGKTATDSGPGTVTSQPPADGVPLQATFQAEPGTLLRLRFGQQYRFRARAVDLAGNSLSVDEATELLDFFQHVVDQPPPVLPIAGTEFTYARYEPVPSPVLVPRERFDEGESLERLVIRSRSGTTATEYANALTGEIRAARPTSGAHYRGTSERHAAPPKSSQAMAETHGMFDASFGAGSGFQETYELARSERGSIADPVLDETTGQPKLTPDVDPLTGAQTWRPCVEQVTTGTTSSGDQGYALHHEPQLKLPYLPDPLAQGVALFGLPGLPADGGPAGLPGADGSLAFAPSKLTPETLGALGGSAVHIDFDGNWPDRQPFRIQLADPGPAAGSEAAPPTPPPSWDPQARVLTVFLRQAEQATFRLSCFLSTEGNTSGLEKLGIWQWVVEQSQLAGRQPGPVEVETALEGGHRMITPFRTVKLVHATEAPLSPPTLSEDDLATSRDAGNTFAYIGGTLLIHGKSTAKVDLLASWSEQIDDPDADGPVTADRQAHVFEIPVFLPDEDEPARDTDPGTVPIAEYEPFPQDVLTFQVPPPDDESGLAYLSRHEFGDTKHRKVTYHAVATSRFRECFPPEVADDPRRITVTGNTVQTDILSTARPAAPTVVSVLPTQRWSRETHPDGTRISRRTGGVRVYLKRPWFSSGDEELLGVLVTDGIQYPAPDVLAPYLTHYGEDPVFTSGPITSFPSVTGFLNAVSTDSGLILDELPEGPSASVAGHPVQFDPGRGLWFCDIEVAGAPAETYCPFLRLALARYQPFSLRAQELSRVVQTDFVQLSPPRTVTVSPLPGTADAFGITVDGPSYRGVDWSPDEKVIGDTMDTGKSHRVPPLIEVGIQQRIPGTQDDLGWRWFQGGGVRVDGAQPAGASGSPLWSGQVTLPANRQPGQFRVVILENEHLATDELNVRTEKKMILPDPEVLPHLPPHLGTVTYTWMPGADRLVFAETVEF
ncbi:hypothetical protein ACFY1P_03575 [Streptomyces sp. NPDC001407]|uniref:hypothetical protein n=1 Tax=Streptomyces sp. NPDC001407 TaxID=3364573 RepID=UPI0036768EE2